MEGRRYEVAKIVVSPTPDICAADTRHGAATWARPRIFWDSWMTTLFTNFSFPKSSGAVNSTTVNCKHWAASLRG
jgi:hypothetical protein